MRTEADVNQTIDLYGDMVRRICLCHLKSPDDAEDVFQNTFLKYMLSEEAFASEEHRKAWLIRVSINACKDHFRVLQRSRAVPLEDYLPEAAYFPEEIRDVLESVLSLPGKYRDVIYLHYYEGYSAYEISRILKKKENTIYSLLSRGRNLLKKELGGDDLDK